MNDKDNAATLVTGILIAGEIQRRNDDIRREQEHANNRLNADNQALEKSNADSQKQNNKLLEENEDLEDDLRRLKRNNVALFNKAQELQTELDQHKALLRKPLAEIAGQNSEFNEAYQNYMEMLAEWMVSQKAFKELAIQLGKNQGLTATEVILRGNRKKLDVLANANDPNHGTNGNDVTTIENRLEILKAKIQSQLQE